MTVSHVVAYGSLVWYFNLLHNSERQAIASWMQKTSLRFSHVWAGG
jgi:hypothetical protein